MTHESARENPGPWPRRLALATALATLPLFAFGGTVTTLRQGLAIDGWWVLEPGRGDHFLLFFPVEKWFRDAGTFVEHTHRLFGVLVGLLALAGVAANLLGRTSRGSRALALAGLAAVCLQGALGGFRVLEQSSELAFLHGAFAQAVFALLAAGTVVSSEAWRSLPRSADEGAVGLRRTALVATAAVYAQIVVGAWLRHSGAPLALAAHVLLVALVVAAVLALARRLRLAHESGARVGLDRSPLERARRALVLLLAAQLVLGILAAVAVLVVSGGFLGPVSVSEMIFATLHVVFGAFLLSACLASALWSHRLLRPSSLPAGSAVRTSLGGAS